MNSLTGMIFNIQKYSLHDGPGIRTTIFFKGCALKCSWCHNPESQFKGKELMLFPGRCIRCETCVEVCKQGAISLDGGGSVITDRSLCIGCGDCVKVCFSEAREIAGRKMSVAEVMEEIEKDLLFYDSSGGGITISGGEPLLQPDFLRALMCACKEKEIHTALDTCGYASWKVIDKIRDDVDLFLYDLKLMDDARHREFIGVSNISILRNLQMLVERGHQIVLRIPIITGINDDEENIRQIGKFAATLFHIENPLGFHQVDLLPYHHIAKEKYRRLNRTYTLEDVRPPSEERMGEIALILQSYDLFVKIGG